MAEPTTRADQIEILLPWLFTQFPAFDLWTAYHWWLGYTALTIALSLVMDAYNLLIWMKDRRAAFAKPGDTG